MSGPVAIHSADGVIAEIPGHGIVLAAGTTVPSDGRLGYAPGCLFIHVDGAAASCLYKNDGTAASCDFDAFPDH